MPTTNTGTTAAVDQAAALGAEVNAPALTTIFDPAGRPMQVAPATADLLIAYHGFRRQQVNLTEAANQFYALFAAPAAAIGAYIDGVIADGHIDTSDQAAAVTAQLAMRQIEESWAALNNEIARAYPVRQGEATPLYEQRAVVTLNGVETEMSLLELGARRLLDPENAVYAEPNVIYTNRLVAVDPGQVAAYLATPGWSQPA